MGKSSSGMSRALVRRETIAGYLFLLPSLFFFVTFVVYPMFMCIYTSFFDSNMGKDAVDTFIGFGNYKELLSDQVFLGALKNTLTIVVVAVPTVCAFSLWVASAITDMKPALTSAFLLSAGRDGFRGCHGRVEVDVQQLLRHLQLSAQRRWHHREKHQLAG